MSLWRKRKTSDKVATDVHHNEQKQETLCSPLYRLHDLSIKSEAAMRDWVGLPTVVILDIYAETLKEHRGGSMPDGQIAFAKAIEQALKERNI